MRLTRLEIVKLPGIEPGFAVEGLSGGIHLIVGPNAVGKSSLVRALRFLLEVPKNGDPPDLYVEAVFSTTESTWSVSRQGGSITWRRDGGLAERPPIADPDEFFYYRLDLEHLLAAEAEDRRFLREVRRQLQGGFDLAALRREAPFSVTKHAGRSCRRAFEGARRTYFQVQREYQALQQEEAALPEMEAKQKRLEQHMRRLPCLERALEYLRARNERVRLDIELAAYPPHMERLQGDEPEHLERLREETEQLRKERFKTEALLQDALGRLEQSGFAAERPREEDLEAQRDRLGELKRLRERREQEEEDLLAALVEYKQACRDLGAEAATAPNLSPEVLEEAAELAERLHELCSRKRELEWKAERVGERPSRQEIDQIRSGLDALQAWATAEEISSNRLVRVPLALILAGSAVALVEGLIVGSPWLTAGAVAAVLGTFWVWWWYFRSAREAAVTKWKATGLVGPEEWSRAAVEARRRELKEQELQLEQGLLADRERRQAQTDLERLAAEEAAARDACRRLRARTGVDPEKTLDFARFHVLVKQYQQAVVQREKKEGSIQRLESEIASLTDALAAFIDRWGEPPVDRSVPCLEAALKTVARRREAAEDAEHEVRSNTSELRRLEQALADKRQEQLSLLARAGLGEGQESELRDRCLRLPQWRELKRKRDETKGHEDGLRKSLEAEPEILEVAEREGQPWIERALGEARRASEEYRRASEELARLRERLENAGKERKLEQAGGEMERARAALEDAFEQALRAETAQFLLDEVERQYQTEHEPGVLRSARDYFATFTNHAYDLRLDPGEEEFIAAATAEPGRPLRRIGELSTATRMQLLLAVRLAWISRLEQGREALPLFLDEALTTTDVERFTAVARSLQSLVDSEARQIFYLTARCEEAAMWEKAVGQSPHVVDLAVLRFRTTEPNPALYSVPQWGALPEPAGRSPEQYAVLLGVPPVLPESGWEDTHLFHILRDDLELLHRSLQDWRISRVGALETLLESPHASRMIPDKRVRETLRLRCRVVRTWTEARRRGRSRPLTRGDIQISRAVSERFLDAVCELAEQYGGDAAMLLARLEAGDVKGFGSAKIAKLAAWLDEHGYLPAEEVLDKNGRWLEVLRVLGSSAEPGEIRRVVDWLEAGMSRDPAVLEGDRDG